MDEQTRATVTFVDRFQIELGALDNRTGSQQVISRVRLTDQLYLIGDLGHRRRLHRTPEIPHSFPVTPFVKHFRTCLSSRVCSCALLAHSPRRRTATSSACCLARLVLLETVQAQARDKVDFTGQTVLHRGGTHGAARGGTARHHRDRRHARARRRPRLLRRLILPQGGLFQGRGGLRNPRREDPHSRSRKGRARCCAKITFTGNRVNPRGHALRLHDRRDARAAGASEPAKFPYTSARDFRGRGSRARALSLGGLS